MVYGDPTRIMESDRIKDHASYVAEVAKAAFPYPNEEHPDWSVHVNLPMITVEVPVDAQTVIAPDIVVLEGAYRTAVICGEVVGARDRMDDEVEKRWRPVTRVSRLYLFVPVGWANDAKKTIKNTKVEVARLFTYRWTPQGMEINRVEMTAALTSRLFKD